MKEKEISDGCCDSLRNYRQGLKPTGKHNSLQKSLLLQL